MNSPFANFYLAAQEALKNGVAALKWIDQDFGQLETYDQQFRPPVLFPCALLDLPDWQFTEAGNNSEEGSGFFQVRIGYAPFTQSNQVAVTSQREKALSAFEIEQAVYMLLKGKSLAGFGPLSRVSAVTEKRDDNTRVRVITFKTRFTDNSAEPAMTVISRPEPSISENVTG